MTPEEVTAFFMRRLEAYVCHDALALAATYANDCVVESPTAGTVHGRSAVEAVFRHWFTAFPDNSMSSDELLSVGDRVVQLTTVWGTDTGGFLGQAPTGKPFRLECVLLFTLGNGQILHERRVYDMYGLMAQLSGTQLLAAAETALVYRATLERARMERELQLAAEIQRALLPELHQKIGGFEVAAASVPCRAIGGDFFDCYQYENGSFSFCLGDVAGKGPPAALLAAELQGILASQSQVGSSPADVMSRLNRVFMRRAVVARFATLFYGLVDGDGRLTYCNAGHNLPFLVRGDDVQRLATGGLIVGAFEHVGFDEATVQLYRGDVLIVFSDGITEAEDRAGVEFGDERLLSFVQSNRDLPPHLLLHHIVNCVKEFSATDVGNDDQTALIVRYSAE